MKDILKEKRLALGYSQEQLAFIISVKQTQISRWESGKVPQPHNLLKLMLALDLTVEDMGVTL